MRCDSFIEDYFTGHLLVSSINTFTGDEKKAAVNMAKLDISALLGRGLTDDEEPQLCAAVAEQAIYLLLNQTDLICNAGVEIASEKIEGMGSRTYRRVSGGKEFLSRRAAALAAPFICGTALISRG